MIISCINDLEQLKIDIEESQKVETKESGTKSVHTTSPNNSWSFSVTFTNLFIDPPEVTATANTVYDDGTYSSALGVTVSNITRTGCTFTVGIWCAYPTTTTVKWTAIGYVKK